MHVANAGPLLPHLSLQGGSRNSDPGVRWLAVCDARSIAPADFVKHQLRYRDRTGEVYSVVFNPDQRWLYFPNMPANEAVLIKRYDSDARRARFTAHSAFDDHTAPPDAPARESIEVRTLIFFAPESLSTFGGFGG